MFLENELLYGQHFDVPELDDYVLPIGKARIVRPGKDVTLVSYSIGVGVALEAAQELTGRGDRRRGHRPAHPAPARQGGGARKPQAHQPHGGGRGRLADLLDRSGDHRHRMTEGFDDLDAPVLRVTNADVPLPYAANLEKLALIKAAGRGRGGESRLLSLNRRCGPRPDVRLSLAGRRCGPAFDALCASIDDAMARCRRAADASRWLGAIRLAWWRERLEELDRERSRRPSRGCGRRPRAAAARDQRRRAGRAGARLGGAARPFPMRPASPTRLAARAASCSRLAARLLGQTPTRSKRPARSGRWSTSRGIAATRLARRLLTGSAVGRSWPDSAFPRALRPLTMLAALARARLPRGGPFEREGTPGRACCACCVIA